MLQRRCAESFSTRMIEKRFGSGIWVAEYSLSGAVLVTRSVDFVASYQQLNQTGTVTNPSGNNLGISTVGVQLAVPLFAGGKSSAVR